jgi:hypothetical protein
LRGPAIRSALVLGLSLVAATAVAPASSEPQVAGSLELQATLVRVSEEAPCPEGVPAATTDCRARIGTSFVRGLGIVSVAYDWPVGLGPPTCPAGFAKLLATTGRLIVAGKGEITFTIAEGARCMRFAYGPEPDFGPIPSETGLQPRNEPQEFTITGGTRSFAAASGSGKLDQRWFNWSREPDVGAETWTGTIQVPDLTFDVTPPTLSGATAKTVLVPTKGAKSARVTFRVTATDEVDGALPVSCRPGSGSRFEVGRTTVRCEATDSSGNTAEAGFIVGVKRRP